MSAKSAMENRMIEKGIKKIDIEASVSEWIRWLEYFPASQIKIYNRLCKTKNIELSIEEKKWFNNVELDLEIARYLRTMGQLTPDQANKLKRYMDTTSIDSLIARKLTEKEYKFGQKKAKKLIEELNEYELRDLYNESINNFDGLDMVQSFVIREIGKVVYERQIERSINITSQKFREHRGVYLNSPKGAKNRACC